MVREARREDLNQLLTLLNYLDEEEGYAHPENYTEAWEEILGAGEFMRCFVAEEGEILAATCTVVVVPNLSRDRSPYALLENLITRPGMRRRGFARAVVEAAVEYARRRGCYKVLLLSSAERTESHAFYRSLGFDGESKKGFQIRLTDRF